MYDIKDRDGFKRQIPAGNDRIDYEWQTRRSPVNAEIQEKTDGRLAVTAGRSDELTHPLLDVGTRAENKLRAKYVHAAVDGRTVKSGEETTIAMPSRREGVENSWRRWKPTKGPLPRRTLRS